MGDILPMYPDRDPETRSIATHLEDIELEYARNIAREPRRPVWASMIRAAGLAGLQSRLARKAIQEAGRRARVLLALDFSRETADANYRADVARAMAEAQVELDNLRECYVGVDWAPSAEEAV